jgi:tetratricopeptide (TPR) repeat protein
LRIVASSATINTGKSESLGKIDVVRHKSSMTQVFHFASRSFLLLALFCGLQVRANDLAPVPNGLAPVISDLSAGRADDAISRLSSSLLVNPRDGEAHNLLCRVYYQEERWDDAIRECETAVQLMPENSEYHRWLGRAYGGKANRIHSIKAYPLARKVRHEFEQAVQLDGENLDALSDLGEFYTAAPKIVGGDKKKAEEVARLLEHGDPVEACRIRGSIAEKDGNYALAETQFRAAVEVSKNPADAWMTLASFYSRRHQLELMLQAVHSGIDADAKAKATKMHGPALVRAAALLSRNNQEPQLAIQLLRLYLESPNKSADWPAFQVHAELGRLLRQQGDEVGAQQQIEAATALAQAYHLSNVRGASRSF